MKTYKAVLLSIPMLLISALFVFHGKMNTETMIARIIVYIVMNTFFIRMLVTGKTYRYRTIIFISAALLFPIGFIYHNIIERGSMLLSMSTVYECKVPFCHIVTSMLIIPVAIARTIPFPGSITGSYASIASMLVLLFSAVIVIGRGWCAWGCFYGGWDECFSKLRKKPVYSLNKRFWKLLPYAVLVSVALLASYTLTPIYCQWFCPFKPVTEFEIPSSIEEVIPLTVFFSMFVIFLIILPLLTKKRAQCTCFCPLGPTIIAFFNRFNIFAVRIDKEKCINCKKCIKVCPLNAIDETSLSKGKTLSQCAKCAKCIDECPQKAIMFYIRGTKFGIHSNAARIIYLYSAWILMVALLGSLLIESLSIIFKFLLYL